MNNEKKLRRLLREYIEEVMLSEADVSQGLTRSRSGEQVLVLDKPEGVGATEEERRKDLDKKTQGFLSLADSIVRNFEQQSKDDPEKIGEDSIASIEAAADALRQAHKDGKDTDAVWATFLQEMQRSLYAMSGLTRVSPKYSALS
jgi:hypothetical protein